MFIGGNEDEHYDWMMEEYTHGYRPTDEWEEMDFHDPVEEQRYLYLDGKKEQIEAEYGCSMSDLSDRELGEIVESMTEDDDGTLEKGAPFKWLEDDNCIEYTALVD